VLKYMFVKVLKKVLFGILLALDELIKPILVFDAYVDYQRDHLKIPSVSSVTLMELFDGGVIVLVRDTQLTGADFAHDHNVPLFSVSKTVVLLLLVTPSNPGKFTIPLLYSNELSNLGRYCKTCNTNDTCKL